MIGALTTALLIHLLRGNVREVEVVAREYSCMQSDFPPAAEQPRASRTAEVSLYDPVAC
jgi:hypothetical protein